MSKISFPTNFWWGGVMLAEQTEGVGITKKGETIFQHHFQSRSHDFWKKIGPNVTIDVTRNY